METARRRRAAWIGLTALAAGLIAALLVARRAGGLSTQLANPTPPDVNRPAFFAERLDVSTFQRGNIHMHSSLSDGDRPPDELYAWYRDHGYNFVALTDHNRLTDPQPYRTLERPGFVLITGEEVTMTVANRPVHVNALCTKHTINGGAFPSNSAALGWAIAQIRGQGGVALINHPNFDWVLTEHDMPAGRGAHLLEIWSGHPYVHTEGDLFHKSHEAIWDEALSMGESFAGVAVDDTHHLAPDAPSEGASRPGRGWVEVFAHEASEAAICDNLRQGRLYASSGAKLRRIVVEGGELTVFPEVADADVEFIGAHGAVLKGARRGEDGSTTYRLQGSERYVRARITQIDGKRAWTQAYRVAR